MLVISGRMFGGDCDFDRICFVIFVISDRVSSAVVDFG